MKLHKRKNYTKKAELNLPAMIDVILLLLIFFMCTHRFNQPEKTLNSQTVRLGPQSSINPQDFEPVIVILKGNNNSLIIECDDNEFSTFDQLESYLNRITDIFEPEIIIKSQEGIAFSNIAHVLDICKKTGINCTGFSTVKFGELQ